MECILELALLLVKIHKLDVNVQFDTGLNRIDHGEIALLWLFKTPN